MATLDLAAVPKAELHWHIDGLLDAALVAKLATAGHVMAVTAAELAAHVPVASLEHWLNGYGPLAERAQTPKDVWLPLVLEAHVASLRAQRVTYAESFVSSLIGTLEDPGELVDLFHALRARVDAACESALTVEFVICIGRGPPERVARQFPKIMALNRAGLVSGVALAGREAARRVEPLARFFDAFRDAGLGIEIHAGEFGGPDSVRDALAYGHPNRLGHAVRAFEDPHLVEEIAKRAVHVEFCPTSNLRLGVVSRIEEHPLGRAWESGISFSVNTDDPGPFGCTLTSELELVATTFGYREPELARIHRDTLAARFGGF
jgi:adenosine deaminase